MVTRIVDNRKKENAFSLLELSVAVGIAAVLAVAGIVATTAFIGSASEKSDSYLLNADGSISDAEAASRALADGIYADGGEGGGNGSVPPGAVVLFTASNVSTKTATVSWGEPLNGVVTGYKVYVNDELTPTAVLESNVFEYTLTGLTYDTEYNVVVVSYNDSGESPAASLTFTTTVNPLLGFTYAGAVDGEVSFTRGESSQTFTPTGANFTGATFSLTSGTLPTGVTLNPTTGALTGPTDWGLNTKRFGGAGTDIVYSVDLISDGGPIVLGRFAGTATIGSTTLTSAGGNDILVSRFDAKGDHLWALRAGGSGDDTPAAVISTSDGGAIILGRFESTANFGSTALTSSGGTDIFVAKINSSGVWQWAKRAGGAGVDTVLNAYSTVDGGIIFGGAFTGTPSFDSISLANSTYSTMYIAKINSSGVFQWVTSDNSGVNFSSLSKTPDGGAMITGTWSGTAKIGSTTLTYTGAGYSDVFVAKINSTGAWQWAVAAHPSNPVAIATDIDVATDGSAIITGMVQGTAQFGSITLVGPFPGNYDIFVAKISSSGTWQWANFGGGTNWNDEGRAVVAASDGGAILTGRIYGMTKFGAINITSAGAEDIFVAKVNSSGSWEWVSRAGGTGLDEGKAIVKTADGGAIIAGDFRGTATIGTTTLTSSGVADSFLSKINANGSWSSGAFQGSTSDVIINVTKGEDIKAYPVKISTQ